ncbi:ROK family transcriptional regulator [Streptomyces sp. NPDC014727]|uniref:ROK family transcriptional regulator n=1 Tax=Streptomyces sp. NPDC014727 TaxID=3364883 RepID=UPI003702EE16
MSSFNQSVVLELIRNASSGISKAEIAARSGLSDQTVSNAARRLLADRLIIEAGTQVRGRGKPPVMLRLQPRSRFAVGVHLDPAVVTCVLIDLAGEVVARRCLRAPLTAAPDEAVPAIAAEVRTLISDARIDGSAVVGIGVASPGPIDAAHGVILDPPLLPGWRDTPLRERLGAASGLPVLLEKDVNAAALAEIWVIGDAYRSDFAFFYLGSGIGIGLAVDREVLRGTSGNAGDGGALVVPSQDQPRKRDSDMLGHVAAPHALVAQAVDEGVLTRAEAPDLDAGYSELLRRATAGDPGARAIVRRAGRNIASGIVSVVNLLDIDDVVFGGPYWEPIAPLVLPDIRTLVDASPYRMTRKPVSLGSSAIGDDVAAIGAASLVLDTVLSPRPSTLLISSN